MCADCTRVFGMPPVSGKNDFARFAVQNPPVHITVFPQIFCIVIVVHFLAPLPSGIIADYSHYMPISDFCKIYNCKYFVNKCEVDEIRDAHLFVAIIHFLRATMRKNRFVKCRARRFLRRAMPRATRRNLNLRGRFRCARNRRANNGKTRPPPAH